MNREQVIDLYFMEARAKLIDLAAFLDRVDRAPGTEDFRMAAFRQALEELPGLKPDRAKRVLLSLSDPTTEPLQAATTKSATGAWPGSPRPVVSTASAGIPVTESAARDARQGGREPPSPGYGGPGGRAPQGSKK